MHQKLEDRARQLASSVNRSRIGRFSTVGIALTVFGAVFIWVFEVVGLRTDIGNLLQAVISIELNFLLSDIWTWGDRRHESRLTSKLVRYHLVKFGVTIPLNQLIYIGTLVITQSWLLAYLVSTGVITVINWVAGNRFVFRSQKSGEISPK